jgi:hypothetical protein
MGFPKNKQIDHIDHNRLDNRKCNLRLCTNQENSRNKGLNLNNTSGVKGVYFDKQLKKWRARITINYKSVHLGIFDDLEEAKDTYNQKTKEVFGRFNLLEA